MLVHLISYPLLMDSNGLAKTAYTRAAFYIGILLTPLVAKQNVCYLPSKQ